ncbi:hypothetical protein [Rhodopseudomonas palustris]|uniref:hypothetical protein n=1 Tax=Rhodopseudomonas palustris TaxID=1076 RepID=UPI00131E2855|nr:hypothetical protein [Rhodopseudomonas palustris]
MCNKHESTEENTSSLEIGRKIEADTVIEVGDIIISVCFYKISAKRGDKYRMFSGEWTLEAAANRHEGDECADRDGWYTVEDFIRWGAKVVSTSQSEDVRKRASASAFDGLIEAFRTIRKALTFNPDIEDAERELAEAEDAHEEAMQQMMRWRRIAVARREWVRDANDRLEEAHERALRE